MGGPVVVVVAIIQFSETTSHDLKYEWLPMTNDITSSLWHLLADVTHTLLRQWSVEWRAGTSVESTVSWC
jgi:hypothetical protein